MLRTLSISLAGIVFSLSAYADAASPKDKQIAQSGSQYFNIWWWGRPVGWSAPGGKKPVIFGREKVNGVAGAEAAAKKCFGEADGKMTDVHVFNMGMTMNAREDEVYTFCPKL